MTLVIPIRGVCVVLLLAAFGLIVAHVISQTLNISMAMTTS